LSLDICYINLAAAGRFWKPFNCWTQQ